MRSCKAERNGGIGFRLPPASLLLDSSAFRNGSWGAFFLNVANEDSASGYGRNVLTKNNGGNANAQVGGFGAAFQVDGNVCGTGLCP